MCIIRERNFHLFLYVLSNGAPRRHHLLMIDDSLCSKASMVPCEFLPFLLSKVVLWGTCSFMNEILEWFSLGWDQWLATVMNSSKVGYIYEPSVCPRSSIILALLYLSVNAEPIFFYIKYCWFIDVLMFNVHRLLVDNESEILGFCHTYTGTTLTRGGRSVLIYLFIYFFKAWAPPSCEESVNRRVNTRVQIA